jgi:hypothetical protein
MSLLLEALKKAEKAKEEAQRRERGESAAEVRTDDATGGDGRPVLTRAELPDIKQPLEILSDDLEPMEAPVPAAPARPAAARPEPARSDAPQAAERAAARKVFEAKQYRESNPRLPFFITLGVLGVLALGTIVYFWYQLRPPPPLVNTNPVRPAAEAAVQVAEVKAPAASPSVPVGAVIPGLPAVAPAAEPIRPEPRV